VKIFERIFDIGLSRRNFLSRMIKAASLALLYPLMRCKEEPETRVPETAAEKPKPQIPGRKRIVVKGGDGSRLLLKNGLIVDGTGKKAFLGDLLIEGDRIEMVTPGELVFRGRTIDCTGKVIAPGFIDAHSHMDWILPIDGYSRLKTPFTAQGVTTFVAGNCGYGVAGFRRNSQYRDMLEARTRGLFSLKWDTMEEYFNFLRSNGISHNLVNLAGHGTTRMSIRGYQPTPMTDGEMKEMLSLLEEAMDQGAYGVSFGLQYEPGIFATLDELKQVAKLVKSKGKIITSHMKAYSSLSGTYPLKPFGRPHNLLAIEDMLTVARETGVKMQLSHLIFVGEDTWDTCEEALELIDRAIQEGIDVKFDTYAYHCGTSVINVFFPGWFLARAPEVYRDRWALLKLRAQLELIVLLLGFGYEDIQITYANHPDLNRYNGMFLKDIAKERGMSQFENFIDFAEKSEGRARVLNHRYSNLDNIKALMKHPAALFMTDATVATEGAQNPACFGNFPRFLQYARDFRLLSLEEVVHKMTGASAERFVIRERGVLRKGYAADITVFDWERIKDNNTPVKTDQRPTGIEAVFINGKQVLSDAGVKGSLEAGRVL
jgi:N-acyl-D-amino-acid deacylase